MDKNIRKDLNGRILPSPELLEQFEILWSKYPKKVDRQIAEKFAIKGIKKYGYEQILRCVDRYVNEKIGIDKQFIVTGGNFFRNRFIDYLDENYVDDEIEDTKVIECKIFESTKMVGKVEGYEEYLKVMKFMQYNDYLITEHWLHFKGECLKFYGTKCMVCNSDDSIPYVHHRTYENRGRETFNDVIVLCEKCHKLFHNIDL